MMKNRAILLLPILFLGFLVGFVKCQRPSEVNIGAVFTYNSVIGKAAKVAMELAVDDVNGDSSVLNGTKLRLVEEDANCSVFMGSIGAFQVLEKEVVAMIGPQSSAIAHMISAIATGLQVPLISYAATDPTLSALQFPFFFRTTHSDSYQMAAVADLIDFFGWKDVISVFIDDDYGRNGISALDDELVKRTIKISHKVPLPIEFDLNIVTNLLKNSKLLGPRVYVVHVNPDPSFRILDIAKSLEMMSNGYVWFATDWLSATLDSLDSVNASSLHALQGVVGIRQNMPVSKRKDAFLSRWRKMQQKGLVSGLNAYGLYAYDTVWAVARSVDELFKENQNLTFSSSKRLVGANVTNLGVDKLKIFENGELLRRKLLQTNFFGLTGQFKFNPNRNLITNGFEIINVDNTAFRNVGYWSNSSGLSVSPLESFNPSRSIYSRLNQKLENVMWPGGTREKPRGWVIADGERPLKIAVPRRASFVDFVTVSSNGSEITGYCIDVFYEARKLVPYDVPFKFEPFGDGHVNPSYDDLMKMVADGAIDAAVGDITIVTNRTKNVDFSQPYAATGLVIVAPISSKKSSTWVFIRPFTVEMWCAIAASFVVIGIIIWVLEHRINDDFRGPPKRQIMTMFLFSLSTLFKTNQEDTVSTLGRIVMVVWLFLLMVISASYTASLTSFLTVQQLSSPITGIESLIASNWPIGYQVGSYAYGYLTDGLHIPRSRLIPLGSPEDYERALRKGPSNGGVAAIIDELPYIEVFLANRTDFGMIGQTFTKSGWGFAFQRESPLAIDISTAILKLSETGELQKIHDRWFCKKGCPGERTVKNEPNKLHFSSFWGLYLLCGVLALISLFIFLMQVTCQYVRYRKNVENTPSSSSSSPEASAQCSHVVSNFLDFIDKKEEAIKSLFVKKDDEKGNVNC